MYTEITFDKLPEAVAYLIKKIAKLTILVENNKPNPPHKRIPIGIDEACCVVQKAKPTIYALVRKGLIPCYKRGVKLFFFENELLTWIEKGKKKAIHEIREEMETDILYGRQRKK